MFKFFGALAAAAAVGGLASFLLVPFMIVSVIVVFAQGLMRFWPWVLGLLAYAIVAAFIVWMLKGTGLQGFLALLASLVPAVVVLSRTPSNEWLSWFTAALVMSMTSIFAMGACEREKVQLMGALIGVQILWIAPLTLAIYQSHQGSLEVWPVVATIVGLMAAIVTGTGPYDKLVS